MSPSQSDWEALAYPSKRTLAQWVVDLAGRPHEAPLDHTPRHIPLCVLDVPPCTATTVLPPARPGGTSRPNPNPINTVFPADRARQLNEWAQDGTLLKVRAIL